ncbi:hypothetical protein DFH06DRAFT_1215049 [Mycena polygramma]|nr:hypothetical protein DFH06DRAFT_1215049 [Mycena polygramma]
MSAPNAQRSSGRVPTTAHVPGPWTYTSPQVANYTQPGANLPHAPAENSPLLPRQNVGSRSNAFKDRILLLMFVAVVYLIMAPILSHDDALDPAARDRIHREWDKEVRDHEATRRAWGVELADHETIRVGWESERQELIALREQLVHDKEQWVRDREEAKHEEEARRREEDERIRAGFAWDDLRGDDHCLQHGMRRYTARLANVPREYDPVRACTETAVEIHGLKIASPNQCEDRGCGGVIGHWLVNYSEPGCVTHFDYFKDKGCTFPGSRLRRIESHLENLQGGDDWRDMCSTTPANFRQLHFDGPEMCENWGKYGVWGIWNVEDRYC